MWASERESGQELGARPTPPQGGRYQGARLSKTRLVLIVLLHVVALYGLARAFAPGSLEAVENTVLETFSVTVETKQYEPEPVPQLPEPDEGAAGAPGKRATPKAVTAPEPEIRIARSSPVPRASGTGTANRSGARDEGAGTGAAGVGDGTGSGRGGSGTGNGNFTPTKAVKTAGDISRASDYPVPPGGREARVGTSVTIALTVGTNGAPTACRVVRAGPFPTTNARTCDLAMQRFRFEPARDRNGEPVVSVYGWKQDFFN
ncbi:MAG: hypothetical protein WA954_05725 [Parerythrobacter sp.]